MSPKKQDSALRMNEEALSVQSVQQTQLFKGNLPHPAIFQQYPEEAQKWILEQATKKLELDRDIIKKRSWIEFIITNGVLVLSCGVAILGLIIALEVSAFYGVIAIGLSLLTPLISTSHSLIETVLGIIHTFINKK